MFFCIYNATTTCLLLHALQLFTFSFGSRHFKSCIKEVLVCGGDFFFVRINKDYQNLPDYQMKKHQIAKQKTAKLPNEKPPNCRMKMTFFFVYQKNLVSLQCNKDNNNYGKN